MLVSNSNSSRACLSSLRMFRLRVPHFRPPNNPLLRLLRGSESRTDVRTLNGSLGGPEAQTDVLVPSLATLSTSLRLAAGLLVLEDVRLLLVCALALHGQLGRHDCGVEQSNNSGRRSGGR